MIQFNKQLYTYENRKQTIDQRSKTKDLEEQSNIKKALSEQNIDEFLPLILQHKTAGKRKVLL